jgi:ribosome maturation factor RimP
MVNAIVTVADKEKLMAMPTGEFDFSTALGKKVKYYDKNNKEWPGKIIEVSEPMLVIKFDNYPSGLGQGQMLEIED